MIKKIITEVKEGQKIRAIKGQITDFRPQATYKKNGEEKTVQNVSIKDATGFIGLAIFGGDEIREDDIGKTIECRAKEDGSFAPMVGKDKYTKRKNVVVTGMWRRDCITGDTDDTMVQEFRARQEKREAKRAAAGGGVAGPARLPFKTGLDHFMRLYRGVRKNCPELKDEALVGAVGVLFNGVSPSTDTTEEKTDPNKPVDLEEGSGVREVIGLPLGS